MSNDSFSTPSLSDINSTKLCASKTIQAMNRLDERNLGTNPDNPSMGDINDITASTYEKTRNDTEPFPKFYGTYHKSVAAEPVFHSNLPTKNTLESATEPFPPHRRSDTNKQSDAQWHAQQRQQDSVTN